jgi:putative flavoprotein involved in K+ transport
MIETIETVIIGGGQAGLSLSHELQQAGREHVVLEKASRAGEAWRNQRWDSFTLVTPNWSFVLPGAEFHHQDPNGFMPRDEIVRCFEAYAAGHRLPVRYNTTAHSVQAEESSGYTVQNGDATLRARNVVVATGLFQREKVPAFSAQIPSSVAQIHCAAYRNPESLPPGAVLVAGSGQSGCQIAEELLQAGRKVYLATGFAPHAPRRYRGRDIIEWADQSGFLDRTSDMLPSPAARFGSNPLLTGKDGGHSLDLHEFYRKGMVLLGHLLGFVDVCFTFAGDLKENLAKGDKARENLITLVDSYIARNGIDAPPEALEAPRDAYQAPDILTLDLVRAGIGTVIWAIGFNFDYSLVKLPVTDDYGFPLAVRGKTRFDGLYFLGMPWLYKQRSGLLLGVVQDAAYLAEQIVTS